MAVKLLSESRKSNEERREEFSYFLMNCSWTNVRLRHVKHFPIMTTTA